jgi:FAD/FMN-containing dehydrogenase
MVVDQKSLVAELSSIVGESNVIPENEAQQQYASDQYWYAIASAAAGQALSRPDVAVRPSNVQQVVEIVKFANRVRVPLRLGAGAVVYRARPTPIRAELYLIYAE